MSTSPVKVFRAGDRWLVDWHDGTHKRRDWCPTEAEAFRRARELAGW